MIKKVIFSAVIILLFLSGYSQNSNLVFFTEQGEPFYVVINGVKRNSDARSNVKVQDLKAPSYKCKIIFKNINYGQVDKTIYLNQSTEATYVIKKNAKNKWIIRLMNEAPVTTYIPEPNYNPYPPQPTGSNNNATVNDPKTGTNVNQNAVNINLNLNTGTINNIGNTNQQMPVPSQPTVVHAIPGYTGPYGCNYPMSAVNFAAAKNSISSKTFENSKFTIAKQVITNNCLATYQIKEIMRLFDFENTRLDFAKFAWGYTYDKGNYFQLNDAFEFESSIDELNRFIGH